MNAWIKKNLFRTPKDAAITVVVSLVLGYLAYAMGRFVFLDSDYEINRVNLRLLTVGRYPKEELFRISLFIFVSALSVGVASGILHGSQVKAHKAESVGVVDLIVDYARRFWLAGALIALLVYMSDTANPLLLAISSIAALLVGRIVGVYLPRFVLLATVVAPFVSLWWLLNGVDKWDDVGGFYLNIVVAFLSTVAAIPLGIMFALGRRSNMKIISALSTIYIEIVRAGPLFVWLFLAGQLVTFVLPGTFSPQDVLRATIVFALFTAAYMAEIVRGGLQALPQGQVEAGQALGLNPLQQLRYIVLPQALRNVIPAMVGQIISLFKDTTLAGIALGLFEMVQVATSVTSQEAFRTEFRLFETMLFAALLFWVVSYTFSKESQRFERKLKVAK